MSATDVLSQFEMAAVIETAGFRKCDRANATTRSCHQAATFDRLIQIAVSRMWPYNRLLHGHALQHSRFTASSPHSQKRQHLRRLHAICSRDESEMTVDRSLEVAPKNK